MAMNKWWGALVVAAVACSPRPAADPRGIAISQAESGVAPTLAQLAAAAPLTVVVFYSESCPCFAVHEQRLAAMAAAYRARGVGFVLVDSEAGAAERDPALAPKLPLPLYADPGGKLAAALGAEYATHSVVLDRSARVRYRGAIDSDRTHLTPGAEHYLERALTDLLAGRDASVPAQEPLGCELQIN